MAGIDGVGSIGGSDGLDEFKKAQAARVTEAQTQAAEARQSSAGGDSSKDTAQSVGNAQGGETQQYPEV